MSGHLGPRTAGVVRPGVVRVWLPEPVWRLLWQLRPPVSEGGLSRLLGEVIGDQLGSLADPTDASARHQAQGS